MLSPSQQHLLLPSPDVVVHDWHTVARMRRGTPPPHYYTALSTPLLWKTDVLQLAVCVCCPLEERYVVMLSFERCVHAAEAEQAHGILCIDSRGLY